MNLPGEQLREPTNDRRAVPRHIRDGEHDMLDDALGQTAPAKVAARRIRLWIYLVVLLAGGFGLWIAGRAG